MPAWTQLLVNATVCSQSTSCMTSDVAPVVLQPDNMHSVLAECNLRTAIGATHVNVSSLRCGSGRHDQTPRMLVCDSVRSVTSPTWHSYEVHARLMLTPTGHTPCCCHSVSLDCRRITPHPAVTTASRRQVLEASTAMAAAAAGSVGGQTAGEALAAQSSGPEQQQDRPPETPCDLTRMRAYW